MTSLAAPLGLVRPQGQSARLAGDITILMLALFIPTAAAGLIDERTLLDVSVWSKPMKFQLSLAMHFATAAILLRLLPEDVRDGRWLRGWVYAASAAAIFEILYMMVQAARGRESHFNRDTALEGHLYDLMGVGAMILVLMSFMIGFAIWRRSIVSPGLRLGAAWGLMIGSVLTPIIAIGMASGAIDGPGHWVGGVRSDATHLPIVGWVTSGGDMRVPHFFATHLMQFLPVVGWFADRYVPARAVPVTLAAGGVWIAIIVATYVQAFMGLPLIALGQ